jgi:hypothetical protein
MMLFGRPWSCWIDQHVWKIDGETPELELGLFRVKCIHCPATGLSERRPPNRYQWLESAQPKTYSLDFYKQLGIPRPKDPKQK